MNSLSIKNNSVIPIATIPVMSYESFYRQVSDKFSQIQNHCVCYYAFFYQGKLKFICGIANDQTNDIGLLSHEIAPEKVSTTNLLSLTEKIPALHIFEREIHENFGVNFTNHPWLKPVRFPHDRHHQKQNITTYPFYEIKSEQLHEVGVGPIHAGIIEPGHFRFICNGENVLHLEIQLGWQHRGVETLFLKNQNWLYRNLLAESIAGDTVIGHSLTFVSTIESLSKIKTPPRLEMERVIALELERMAIHTGDMSALCTDIAYQLGAAVFGVLRTPLVNFMQRWGGNRLGKGLIRLGGSHYSLTSELRHELQNILADYKWRFLEMAHQAYHLVSLQNRFDQIGAVSKKQMQSIGAVGMSARMTGLERDIRKSHPFASYQRMKHELVLLETGDVFARFLLRSKEIQQSMALIKKIIADDAYFVEKNPTPSFTELKPEQDAFCLSLVEGWRGEICHTAVTDHQGNLLHYKIKDPSMHNWKALELSLRDLEISDFPINNKSYNLSYCGHDL